MPPRISPLKDAIQHVVSKTDKTCRLEVKYINAVKGRGVFAKGSICKGDFVVEYRGDMINDAESQRRRKLYHPSCAAFMFAFKWRGKTWCIDAAREDGSFGRLVNDEHQHPNCRMKKIDVNGKPHLCLFALNDIKEGEEVTYDYGGEDCPWRTKVGEETANDANVENSNHPFHLKTGDEHNVKTQQISSIQADTMAACNFGRTLLSKSQMDDATGPTNTTQQISSVTDNAMVAHDSRPSLLSKTQMDDATGPTNTTQQVHS
ncbi:histone-lysine N-methyltransferase set-1-like [Pygocentrus nattereri]|uniref:histone-lysine N-methyltransferase set-1-like n=1 Tax=Pygocentrus nattereri TaxID=42514 RepID=UPI001891D587|nr:histone-lysine N-methyltransferase set-1-like [Pygocentrus nattereri]